MRKRLLMLLLVGVILLPACGEQTVEGPTDLPAPAPPSLPLFEDVTSASGLAFRHSTGATGEKFLPETLGSGVCSFDYDNDGWTDLYFANGITLAGTGESPPPTNHLFRNRGDGRFEDVTDRSGTGDVGYGLGCTVGDMDGDGNDDLYLTNFGPNVLYRNLGDGTFRDVTSSSGTGDPSFSTSATFLDVDADGDLDLYVVNYMVYRLEENKYCGELKPGYRAYCGPEAYPGARDRLYRNEGDGRFVDVTSASGIHSLEGVGLGVVACDYDADGDQDLYVANDGMLNYLFQNDGQGSFQEVGLLVGAALGDEGAPQSGMGADCGDYDADGWFDLFVSNLSFQPSALYRNNGDGTFTEQSFTAGIAGPTQLQTGYGNGFFDFDNDGHLDLYEFNGNMLDNVELYFDNVTYPEPGQVFRNLGNGTFEEVAEKSAPELAAPRVGRGSAILDYDGDGALDLVLVVADAEARLFRNSGPIPHHWLGVRLLGTHSNRNGFGAKVRIWAGGRSWVQPAKASTGFASHSESTIHFGLDDISKVERLEITWPSGTEDLIVEPPVDQVLVVKEGSGRAEPLRRGR